MGRAKPPARKGLQRLPSGLEAYGLEAASESDFINYSIVNFQYSFAGFAGKELRDVHNFYL